LNWQPKTFTGEIPFSPARILMQDFTGVPAIVDLASMRDAAKNTGANPRTVNPKIDVDLIVDHSVQVDYYGTVDSLYKNVKLEYDRNTERYRLLKWAQKSFSNFNVIPSNAGICHQVNLENVSTVAKLIKLNDERYIIPDTLLGKDSHTPMINGLSSIGWGVGGIEAEAVLLGLPYYLSVPAVIGVKFINSLNKSVNATDLVLNIAYILRKYGVVGKFVEYYGPGLKKLSVADRATISNMTPEYGATVDYFPIDDRTLEYLNITGRNRQSTIVEAYSKKCGLFYMGDYDPQYTDIIEVDLSKIEPSLSGPTRPHDRVFLKDMKANFESVIKSDKKVISGESFEFILDKQKLTLKDGDVVIAAITSCTNTSNPFVMIGAGLIAKKAVELGLSIKPYVKTSLAPGSKVVYDYLKQSGLLPYLEALKFHIVGYGCTTCIGNSGPLRKEIEDTIVKNSLTVAAVLSGNRNFEARIHPLVRANFLASPMLVVIYAIAGSINIDLLNEPVASTPNGEPVFLKDLWPSDDEIEYIINTTISKSMFEFEYSIIHSGDDNWKELEVDESLTYGWEQSSTYIQKPTYFDKFSIKPSLLKDIKSARVLLLLGDTVTTDHISPAGRINPDYPAGKYLLEKGVKVDDFNSYGSRRGNHNVMIRGTFGNVRIKNLLVSPKEGGFTLKLPENKLSYIFDAAKEYEKESTPLIILAGKEYGAGSSRDWAAKGTALLGVKAIIAESFERIHRSNLIGMGVLPLLFKPGENYRTLKLDGREVYSIFGLVGLKPKGILNVEALKDDGSVVSFEVISGIELEIELEYYINGGILPYILRNI
jgi:aconitate hydratase